MVESEEELKRLLMKVKRGEWKSWLKPQHSKNNIIASGPNNSWQISLFHSVSQLCLTLQPHGLQYARLPYPSLLLELTQTHVHWVSDAFRPSHSLSSPSPPAFNHSQHQDLCKWVSIGVSASTSVLPMNIQGPFPLGWTGWISFPIQVLSRIFSNTTVQKLG